MGDIEEYIDECAAEIIRDAEYGKYYRYERERREQSSSRRTAHISSQGTLEELGLRDKENEYIISFNGGAITENKNNRRLFFRGITYEKMKMIFDAGLGFSRIKCKRICRLTRDLFPIRFRYTSFKAAKRLPEENSRMRIH